MVLMYSISLSNHGRWLTIRSKKARPQDLVLQAVFSTSQYDPDTPVDEQ